MRRVFASKTFLGIVLVLGSLEAVLAQQGTEPLGGQPPRGARASVTDLDYQLKYQRAFEARCGRYRLRPYTASAAQPSTTWA